MPIFLLLFTLLFGPLSAADSTYLRLNGHLGKEEIAKAEQLLTQPAKQLVISLDSTSGDLSSLLDLAKRIYELKIEKGLHTVVYIEDSAVGPAAILPFLADELYISLSVSWGDISLSQKEVLSTNILRNRVVSFISPHNSQASLLSLLAAAMSDPSVQIVEDNGWKMGSEPKERLVTSPGQALVVNQNQLQELKLVKGVLAPDQFRKEFAPAEKETPPPSEEKSFEERLKEHIKFNPTGPNQVELITIEDRTSGINEGTWIYVKKALDDIKERKPIFVILELNTPGGEVFAAQKISDALKELDTQENIPVIAYINNWAISAGAMLAYSCRFIVTVKDGAMGAAEPLQVEATGETKTASEKVNSALRADFANRARFFDRNPDIAEAMVDKDLILVSRYGKVVRLDNENQIRTAGPDPDVVVSPKGKLLTLNSEQMIQYGVADWRVTPQKLPAKKSLLFTAPFLKDIPEVTIVPYKMDWKTRFFVFLANPVVSSLLFLGLMVGLYMELSAPGFGLPATVALTCLFLIVLSSFALEIGNWLELILLLTGLAVLFIELFVLPTFGLLGFIGLIFFLAGLFGMMLPGIGSMHYEFDTNTLNAAGEAFFHRLAWLSGTLVVAVAIILLLARYVTPALANFSRFVLVGREQEGYLAGISPKQLPQPGSEGVVMATLRPAGKVMVDEKLYDAVSRGSFIEKGTEVIVEGHEGSSLLVRTK